VLGYLGESSPEPEIGPGSSNYHKELVGEGDAGGGDGAAGDTAADGRGSSLLEERAAEHDGIKCVSVWWKVDDDVRSASHREIKSKRGSLVAVT